VNRFDNPAGGRRKALRARGLLRAAVCCAVAIGVVACAAPDHRSAEERAADQAIVSQVRSALLADADLYAEHIDVCARGGVVWLTGWVTSAEEAGAASRDSRSVPGVQRVINQIDLMDWMVHY